MTARPDTATPMMPDFVSPRRGVRQTMQAALKSLSRLGVELDRIQIRRVGGGWPAKAVVAQHPPVGTPLLDTTRVTLDISAPSAVDALPFAMRDDVEDGMGTVRIMPMLDTPIAKLEAFVGDAGGFFELRPERPASAWRWVRELFALEPGPLANVMVYRLARLLPSLHAIAGTERGLAIALRSVCEVPMYAFSLRAEVVPLDSARGTRLGERDARLGVDAVVGAGVMALARAIVTIGPLTLDEYLAHDTPEGRRHRKLLYDLVVPSAVVRPIREEWHVLPPAGGLRLGLQETPVRLGLNARFDAVHSQGS